MSVEAPVSWSEIDQFVEAFERAYALEGNADPAKYLPPPEHELYNSVLEELLRVALELSWQNGRPKSVEEIIRQFPGIRANHSFLHSLIFEERRLRQQAGENPTDKEYQQRFGKRAVDLDDTADEASPAGKSLREDNPDATPPEFPLHATVDYLIQSNPASSGVREVGNLPTTSLQNKAYVEVLEEFRDSNPHAVGKFAQAITNLPHPGQVLLGFKLLEELGRGAFGRVYLARETELAQRLVVLKIAPNLNDESQTLAQLQHTNIVPILSLHRTGPFQVICMPYHGGNTLAQVVEALRSEATLPNHGVWLTDFLTTHRRKSSGGSPQPSLADFQGMSYVQAVLWLAERVAEGLAYAHACGIHHYDLKPANVLLADNGEPMLLDFNQAEDTKRRGVVARAFIGGTLPYMAPEHLQSMRDGTPRMDGRSDVYSLGLILLELLTGKYPFPLKGGSVGELLDFMLESRQHLAPQVRTVNPAISWTEEAIIRHCLELDPDHRYQSAAQLKEDLELHRNHLPLRHAPNPSWAERVRKWSRRHPRLVSSSSVGAVSVLLLGGLATGLHFRSLELARVREQTAVLEAGLTLQKFSTALRECRALLSQPAPDRRDLAESLQLGETALEYYQPHLGPQGLRTTELSLSASQTRKLQEELPELLYYLAEGKVKQALQSKALQRQAHLSQGEHFHQLATILPGSQQMKGALLFQQQALARLGNDEAQARKLQTALADFRPETPRDRMLIAVQKMSQGRYREALTSLQAVVDQEPQRPVLWWHLGLCYNGMGQHDKAIDCYSTLLALEPENFLAFFSRGRARLEAGQVSRAIVDFDTAHRLRPQDLRVLADRALAKMNANQWSGALQDLDAAVSGGLEHTRLYLLRAIVKQRTGDTRGAAEDHQKFLATTPSDEQSWIARAMARKNQDPHAALADLEEALRCGERRFPAVIYQNQAQIYSELLKDDVAALRALDQAIEVAPEYARARAGRGVLLARSGKRTAALADAREALRLDPSPANMYQVAGIYALASTTEPADRLEAYRLLAAALVGGAGFDELATDPDLQPLRREEAFLKLQTAALSLRQFLQSRPGKQPTP